MFISFQNSDFVLELFNFTGFFFVVMSCFELLRKWFSTYLLDVVGLRTEEVTADAHLISRDITIDISSCAVV